MSDYVQNLQAFISDSWELAKRNLLHIARDPDQLSGLFIVPVVYTLLFRYLFGGAIDKTALAQAGAHDYVNYVMVGNVVLNTLFAAIITCVGVANDLTKGIIDRFRSLPISPTAVIMSYIIASIFRSTIIIAIVALLGLFMGFFPTTAPIWWLCAFGILVLMVFAISSLMILIGIVSRNVEAAHSFSGLLILPLSMISSGIVPLQTMPPFLRIIAQNQPCTHAIETVRSLLFGTPLGNHLYMSLAWFSSITVITFILSTYIFSKSR